MTTCAVWSLFALAAPVHAALPQQVGIDGRLQSQAGGPVADGSYALTFALYGSKTATKATWSEKATVKVSAGRFSHALGSVQALPVPGLSASSASWLGVSVGTDPELPRAPLSSVAYALRAALADSALSAAKLACSGCVGVAQMKFDGDVNLAGHSVKATNGVFTGGLAASTVTATAFIGDGSKLTGVQVTGGACKAGEVVTAVKPDGSVTCAKGGGGGDVLGGKVSDVFTEVAKTATLPVKIPDNTGAVATVQASYGKVGVANTVAIKVKLSNTDLSNVLIKLFPPQDKKTGMTVCDPCGAKDAKSYDVTLTEQSTLKSGSLKDVIGKSLEGIWTLQVLDSAFCLPQLPGNGALCDSGNKLDGLVTEFEVSAKVTSASSVKLAGTLQLAMLTAAPFACDAAHAAHVYFDVKTGKLKFCDGKVWRSLSDSCGNGILELGEECDDGNNQGGDGCSETCTAGMGTAASDPGASCLSIVNACKAKKKTCVSGAYWLDIDGVGGLPAKKMWCDMTTDGGGWTLLYAATGADSEQPLTGDGDRNGEPLKLQHYNVSRALKVAFSQQSNQTLLWRSGSNWLRIAHAPFDANLLSNSTSKWSAQVQSSDGKVASGWIGFSVPKASQGGDFGVTNSGGFDHHGGSYYMLNSGCNGHYLYSYSSSSGDNDAGYDVNTGLGSWTATAGCASGEGGALKFYLAVR